MYENKKYRLAKAPLLVHFCLCLMIFDSTLLDAEDRESLKVGTQKLLNDIGYYQRLIREQSWCYKKDQFLCTPFPSSTLTDLIRFHLGLRPCVDIYHPLVALCDFFSRNPWVFERIHERHPRDDTNDTNHDLNLPLLEDLQFLVRCVLVPSWQPELADSVLALICPSWRSSSWAAPRPTNCARWAD